MAEGTSAGAVPRRLGWPQDTAPMGECSRTRFLGSVPRLVPSTWFRDRATGSPSTQAMSGISTVVLYQSDAGRKEKAVTLVERGSQASFEANAKSS